MSNNNLFGIYFGYTISKTCDQNNGISSIKSERSINGKNFQTKNLLFNDFSVKDEITIKNIKVENRKYIYKNNGVSLQDHINEPMKKLFESYPNEINKIVVSIPVFFQDSQKIIIKDSIKSIKKESKIYFLKEPIAAIISDNIVYKLYKETIGHFYLILMFYDDLYEMSIALCQNNLDKNPDYSIEYSIGEDFNLQDLIKVLENIQQKNKLENENVLEKILKEIKQLFGKIKLDFDNLQKIFILSENGLTEKQSINFKIFLKKNFDLKKKEVIIKFLKIEDTIIKGVEKYASKTILENEGFPIETKKMPKLKLKPENEVPQNSENSQSLPYNFPQNKCNKMNKKKNFEGNIPYINKPIEKTTKKKRKTKNDCNLENIKTGFNEEEIEYNFDTTEYSEKKDNKKYNNGMTCIKSENHQEKLEEMILQLITNTEENKKENLKLQKMIVQSNTENNRILQKIMLENNIQLQKMIVQSNTENNRISQKMMLENNIQLQKMMFENNIKLQTIIKENIFKLDQKYDNKFSETENQIEELQNKVNKISNENKNKNGKSNTFPFIFSKSSNI